MWAFLFISVTACACAVQRQRVLPVFTGLLSLVTGLCHKGGDGAGGGVTYKRVATDSSRASTTTGMVGASKYTVADLEEEEDDDVG